MDAVGAIRIMEFLVPHAAAVRAGRHDLRISRRPTARLVDHHRPPAPNDAAEIALDNRPIVGDARTHAREILGGNPATQARDGFRGDFDTENRTRATMSGRLIPVRPVCMYTMGA